MVANNIKFGTDRAVHPKRRSFQPPCRAFNLELTIMGDSNMKRIKLTQGKFAIVDDADFEWLNRFKWYAIKDRHTFYAARSPYDKNTGKQCIMQMHRQILELKKYDRAEIDHKNHNELDNQRENIRICNTQQNTFNKLPGKNGTSKYKGVCWHKRDKRWIAGICLNSKLLHIGNFLSEKQAALAYDKKAIELFGDFARLNFPEIRKG